MNLAIIKNEKSKKALESLKESIWIREDKTRVKLSEMTDIELEKAIKRVQKMIGSIKEIKDGPHFMMLTEGLRQLNKEHWARPRNILKIDTYE